MTKNFPFSSFQFPLNFKIFKFSNRKIKWQMVNDKRQVQQGMSLLEILVVVSIFAFLGILVTRSIVLTIAGSKKSESLIKVRESLNYSLSVIERQLRNANSIPACPNPDAKTLAYLDQNGNPTSFSCNLGVVGSIASGSANLSASDVNVIGCSIVCTPAVGPNPPVVTVSLEAKDVSAVGIQNADVTLTTQITLRNY